MKAPLGPRAGSISRDARISGVSRILGYGLSLASAVVVSRSLGPSGKGILALGTAIPGLLAIIAGLGLGTAVTVAVREGWIPQRGVLLLLLAYSSALTAIAVALSMSSAVVLALGFDQKAITYPAMVSIGGLVASDCCAGVLQGANRVSQGMWLRQAIGLGYSAIAFCLVLAGFRSLSGILWCMAAWSWACSLVGSVLVLRSAGVASVESPKWAMRLLKFGVRTQAIWVLLALNYRLDMALLASLGSLNQLGVYSIAVGFTEVAWLGANALSAVLLPHLSNVEPGVAFLRAARGLRMAASSTLLFASAVGIGLWLLAVPVFGSGFAGTTVAFFALIPGLVALAAFKIVAIHEIAMHRIAQPIALAGMGVVVNVVANVLLIPRLGPVGAALSSSLSYTSIAVVAVCSFHRRSGFTLRDILLPSLDDLRAAWPKRS
jgi:O-antigen/teichoic acid export membrane protein